MAVITTRAGKGAPLTNAEVDANFTNLNTEVMAAADSADIGTAPNQIPLNQYLGSMAWQDSGAVNVGLLQATSANLLGNVLASVENVYVAADAGAPRLALVKKSGSVPFIAGGAATPIIFAFSNANNITSVGTEVFTERMRLDIAGNLGIGVAPSAWSSTWKAAQLQGGSVWTAAATDFGLAHNAHYTAGGGWTYTNSAAAARHYMAGAAHTWSVAASGTAGTAVTWTDAMRLDASGNLGVGVVSPTQRLDVSFPTGAATVPRALLGYSGADPYSELLRWSGAGSNLHGARVRATQSAGGTTLMSFDLAPAAAVGAHSYTQRAVLEQSGNFGLGTTTFGTSAASVLAIGTGTEPSTGPADTVQFFSVDRSAGNTIPGIRCEGTGVTDAGITNTTVTNKIAIKVNGTVYYLLATTNAT